MLFTGTVLAAPGRFAPPVPEARDIRFDGADAGQRWSLVASASRSPGDPLEGDRATGRLAFDWTGFAPAGQWRGSAFANASELRHDRFQPGADALDERHERTQRTTRFGASLGFATRDWDLTARAEQQSLEAREGLRNGASGARSPFDVHGASLARLSARLASQVRLPLGTLQLAVEPMALRIAADDGALEGHDAVNLVAGTIGWRLPLAGRWTLGAALGRGPAATDDSRALRNPLQGGFVTVLDPALQAKHREVSLAWRGAAADVTATAFHDSTPAALTFQDAGWSLAPRPVVRQGVHVAWRYDVSRFLSLDAQGTFAAARFADGAREKVPGAPVAFGTAGAMLRVPKGWSAWLFVSTLGPRDATGDEAPRIRSTTRVNAQVQHRISRQTRVSLDVFNVFDHRVSEVDAFAASRAAPPAGMGESFLFRPTDARGFLLRVRTTF